MTFDEGTRWLLADAKRLGMSVRQYEKQFRIKLPSGERDIAASESAIGDQPIQATGFSADPAEFVGQDDLLVRYEDKEKHRRTAVLSVSDPRLRRRATRSCASDLSAIRPGPETPARSSGPRTPRRANRARTCVRPSSRGGSLIAA